MMRKLDDLREDVIVWSRAVIDDWSAGDPEDALRSLDEALSLYDIERERIEAYQCHEKPPVIYAT